ncbi:MAG TPA: calcium-binding protein [Rhizomicrobium sp.]|jgi:Ca2+-binding RTX toxin-like protein
MTTIKGTAGDDSLTGTSGNDSFNLSQGGNDTVHGLGGNDVFSFGATFTAADTIDGGDGADTLKLDGDYSAGVTLGAATLANVESIDLAAGNSYKLVLAAATVAAGQSLTVDGSALAAGQTLFFDSEAAANGTVGARGGLGNDTFSLGSRFNANDRFAGGGGDDTMFLSGNYNVAFGGSTIRDISDLVLFGGHNYRFTENDNNVAAAATMNIDGGNIAGSNTLYFNGSHETDGSFNLDAGSGQIAFAGGGQSDVFFMGANLTADDRLNGEGGSDVVYLGGADYNVALGKPTLVSIENVHLGGGFDYHITSGGGIATNATQVWDATALTASDTLSLNFVKETAGSVIVDGGAAATTIIGSQQGDDFDFSVTGQGGFTAADHINGQDGYDRLQLGGDYTGSHAVVLGANTVTNVEEFDFDAGHSYAITIASKTVAAGQSLTVDASALGAGNALTFDGAAAGATSALVITGGAGNDVLTGGAASDLFDLSNGGNDTALGGGGDDSILLGGALTAGDRIDGGTGFNSVELSGDTAVTLGATTMLDIQQIALTGGASYSLTTNDATVAGGSSLTVNAGDLGAGDTLTFDGSAETTGAFFIRSGAGSDELTGGAGADSFIYDNGIALSAATRDIIHAFDFANDHIQFHTVTGIAAAVNAGGVNAATIDANIASILNAAKLPANEAVLLTPQSGNLQGHVFLVVDGNGVAGYQAGADLVVELQGALHTGSIGTANFTG